VKLAVIMGSLMLSLVLSLSLFTDIAGQEEQYPTADAGPDQSVNIGEIVVLNATGSFDPNGKIVSYAWGIEDSDDEAPAVSLNGQNTSIATFTVPMIVGNVSSNSYLFELTVTDNSGFIGSDTTKVIVKGPGVDKHL
jgi:large repetitive protein